MPLYPSQDRLIRKETSLTTLREFLPPEGHIGLRFCPWREVPTDDVIFGYTKGLTTGLTPARAEDAESELARKDLITPGIGRANVIDWAEKDRYTASDVSRYQEAVLLQNQVSSLSGADYPLTVQSVRDEFRQRVARDDRRRRLKLDNRIEWLIMTALEIGGIHYEDDNITFTVDYGRPVDQHEQTPEGGFFDNTNSDPIGAILAMQQFMYDKYGVTMTQAVASRRVLQSFVNSDRFIARSGMTGAVGGAPVDPNYILSGWGPDAARQLVENATGVTFNVYDSVYRTRDIGSQTEVNNRFMSQDKILFLPSEQDVSAITDDMGFGAMLTSPHPEGNWTPGFYEWEEAKVDPWVNIRGSGVKAFPVFPQMQLTYTMQAFDPNP